MSNQNGIQKLFESVVFFYVLKNSVEGQHLATSNRDKVIIDGIRTIFNIYYHIGSVYSNEIAIDDVEVEGWNETFLENVNNFSDVLKYFSSILGLANFTAKDIENINPEELNEEDRAEYDLQKASIMLMKMKAAPAPVFERLINRDDAKKAIAKSEEICANSDNIADNLTNIFQQFYEDLDNYTYRLIGGSFIWGIATEDGNLSDVEQVLLGNAIEVLDIEIDDLNWFTEMLGGIGLFQQSLDIRFAIETGIGDQSLKKDQERANGSTGACFIATEVYGSYEHPNVILFRNFRDSFLKKFSLGRAFIKSYYKHGPLLAASLKNRPFYKKIIRIILDAFAKVVG